MTHDGSSEIAYLDGTNISQAPSFTQVANGSPLSYQLGTSYTANYQATNNGWYTFNRLIDEPAVYSRALTAAEVLNIAQAGSYGKCDPVASVSPGTLSLPALAPGQTAITDNSLVSGGVQTVALLGSATTPAQPPAIFPLSSNSGSGLAQTFAMAFSDTGGVSDMTLVRFIFNSTASNAAACSVLYYPKTNRMFLYNDAGSRTLAQGLTPGASGTVSNRQCSINAAASSISSSSKNFALNVDLTFSNAFSGQKNVYLYAAGSGGNTGLVSKGTWTVGAGQQ